MRNSIVLLWVLLCFGLVSSCASGPDGTHPAANGAQNPGNASNKPGIPPEGDSSFRLGPGDDLNILVYRHSDLSFSSTYVRMDGQIGMPLIGDVKVEGLTVPEARETLEKLYATYIVNPRIVVAVNKAGSQKIYVLGEVNTPGMIKIDDRISLLQAILRSNGVNRDANISEVLVVRKGKAYKLSLKKVLEGDSSQDVAMLNGDIVYVPPTTISDISRSMAYITTILSPFTQVEGGIILAPQVEEVLRGSSKSSSTSISIPAN